MLDFLVAFRLLGHVRPPRVSPPCMYPSARTSTRTD
jgi:hypothetical protein